jgi:hypothetical protein
MIKPKTIYQVVIHPAEKPALKKIADPEFRAGEVRLCFFRTEMVCRNGPAQVEVIFLISFLEFLDLIFPRFKHDYAI